MWDRVDAEELRGFHAAVASDDLLGIVHQDRVTEAELLDALCDLPICFSNACGHCLGTVAARGQVYIRSSLKCSNVMRVVIMIPDWSTRLNLHRHVACVKFRSGFYGTVKINSGFHSVSGRSLKPTLAR